MAEPDRESFESLVRPLLPKLRSFALRMVAHPDDAEELVQDALLKAHRGLASYRGGSALSTWVFSILTRCCLDHLRKRRRWRWDAQHHARADPDAPHDEVMAMLAKPGSEYDAREHLAFCFSCVARSLSPEEAAALFPEARIAALSSDMFGSARALKAEIEKIATGEADIILGTQLVAKGHNFPLLTLVGVIDADLGLQGSDLRAAERTFQLMRQVAGRAGRSERRGEALLQTYQPEHPVIHAILSGDEAGFWEAEARAREAAGVPPYGRMAGIILSGPDVAQVFDLGNWLARNDAALRRIGAQVFGPAPAPIARVRGRHRVRLLVKAAKGAPLQDALARWIAPVRLKGELRLAVDIDPQTFY